MTQEVFVRAAEFAPETFDAGRGAVDVIFTTGADVRRRDFSGEYVERLSLEPGAVDLGALRGAPVLDNHDRFSGVNAILGVVEEARLEPGRGVARIRFGTRPEVKAIAEDVRAGVIRSVSVGYSVEQWREDREGNDRIKTAVRWTPREISFVPLPADAGAMVRGMETGGQMNHETATDLRAQARTIAAALALPEGLADELAARSQSIDEIRGALIREAAAKQPAIDGRAPAVVTRDSRDGLIGRMADGLMARIDPAHQPEAGREFAHARFSDLAKRLLAERGLSTLGSPVELLARAMHTTSDFSVLLAELFNKRLFSLRAAPSPVTQVFRRTTMADFRARYILEIGNGPALAKVNEHGEITAGTIDARELASYRLQSYGRTFAITFQTLVNDDTGALGDLSEKLARGARQWFTSLLVDTITANPKLADGKAVFHADHGNLASAPAVPSAGLAEARLAIRLQKDASGNPIGAAPRFLLVPAALEEAAYRLLAQLYPTTSAEAEVSARGLVPLAEPRLDAKSATAWYLFCDPAEAPVFEYAELQGYEGPRVESRPGFETLGTEFRVVWHVGVGAVDHRGAYLNPGV